MKKETRLSGGDWTYFQPKTQKLKLPRDRNTFLKKLVEICDEIEAVVSHIIDEGGYHPTKNCLPNNYARRLIYQLVRHYLKKLDGSEDQLRSKMEEVLKAADVKISLRTRSSIENNLFFLCYLFAFPDGAIATSERSRAAKLLQQAYSKDVPPKYLIGFILQHSDSTTQKDVLHY